MTRQLFHDFRTIVCTHCGNEIKVPIYCGLRFCPTCSIPRLIRVRSRIAYIINLARTADGFQLKMITLTIRNQPDVSAGCQILTKSFRRLRSTRAWKSRIKGGLYVIEVTGQPHHYHVHLHVLVNCRFFPVHLLSRCWARVAPGKVVYITRIPISKAVRYVTKYLSKPSVSEWAVSDVDTGLRNIRLFQPFGSWHGLSASWSRTPSQCKDCGAISWEAHDIFYSCIRSIKYDRPLVET